MTISNAFTILMRDFTSDIDFTSRTLGFSTEIDVPYGSVGTSSLTLTLLNNDGALTPNGGGTYASTDWFAKAVIVNSLCGDNYFSPSTVEYVFAGLITDFVLEDDGVQSTVTITAVDALSKLTQSGKVTLPIVPSGTSVLAALSLPFSYLTGWDTTDSPFPKLGATSVGAFEISQATEPDAVDYIQNDAPREYESITDLLSNGICNTHNSIIYPYSIYFDGTEVIYSAEYFTSSKTGDNQEVLTFTDVLPLTGTNLTFSTIDLAFETPNLINRSTATGSYTSATEKVSNSSSSQDKYGMRSYDMGTILSQKKNVLMGNNASTENSAQNEFDDARSRCQENVNRKSATSFEPQSLSFTFSQVKKFGFETVYPTNGAIITWINILSPYQCLWHRLNVTWSGAGASSQTASCMIVGRTIEATPSDVAVTLKLDPFFKNKSFELGLDRLGEAKVG